MSEVLCHFVNFGSTEKRRSTAAAFAYPCRLKRPRLSPAHVHMLRKATPRHPYKYDEPELATEDFKQIGILTLGRCVASYPLRLMCTWCTQLLKGTS